MWTNPPKRSTHAPSFIVPMGQFFGAGDGGSGIGVGAGDGDGGAQFSRGNSHKGRAEEMLRSMEMRIVAIMSFLEVSIYG